MTKKSNIWKFVGVWKDLPKEEIDRLHKVVEEGRKSSGKRWKEIELQFKKLRTKNEKLCK